MDETAAYTLEEHRHRYAAWCAARAVLRNYPGANNHLVREALEASDLQRLLAQPPATWPSTAEAYDQAHKQWAQQIVDNLEQAGVVTSFGRAAKTIAIYVKTLVVVGGHAETALARVAHPPIDELLLKALAKDRSFGAHNRSLWRKTAWTKLDADGYHELVESLRAEGLHNPAFWQIERYWLA